jgi:hypothetical protein
MSAHSFRSVFMVASCAGAALGCYLVSLRVASERAALEEVETRIVLAQRDIRLLQTEIGTRGRLAQLERWNVKVMALSAPTADQFLKGGFELARLTAPEDKSAIEAPVVLASAPIADREQEQSRQEPSEPTAMLHQASLKKAPTEASSELANAAPIRKSETAPVAKKAAADPEGGRPVNKDSAKASVKSKDSPAAPKAAAAKPVAKAKALASAAFVKSRKDSRDPLAPLPAPKAKPTVIAKAKTSKDPAKKQ